MSNRKQRQGDRYANEALVTHALQIPDESAWHGYESDLDVNYLHGLFYGKSIEEVQNHFGEGRSIERMGELLFSPRPIFQYYVRAFARFVLSPAAAGDSDSASPFLSLIEEREKRDPGSVRNIIHSLDEALTFVANNQSYFDAPVDIYGDFNEQVRRIYALCDAQPIIPPDLSRQAAPGR
ncbi:MAG: hypothetical protein WC340_14860 [Kiritimatiellia bacterium]